MELRGRQAALAAGLVAALVAAPSVRNGFVQDDHWVVEQRPLLRHPGSLAAVLTEPYWPRGFGGVLWRPAVLASYALDYRISASPHWFHAVNVLWAAAAAAALALLATLIAGPTVGLVTGLLFAVHPVHVEATASVVGRAELVAAVGYALALISALRSEQRPAWLVGVALGAALAIGAKEHAATLPAAVLLVFLARDLGRAGWRRSLTAAAPAAACATVIVMLYFVARRAVAGGAFTPGGLAPGLRGLDLVDRAWAMLAISLEWWRLLLFPVRLSADYNPAQLVVTTALTARHGLAAVVWIVAGLAAWRLRASVPGVAVGLVWLVLTILPVSNVIVPTEVIVAERTLFLPSWGVMLALATLGASVPWPRRAKAWLLALALGVGAVRSGARIAVWRDDESFFAAQQRDAPRSFRTLWLEGLEAFRQGQPARGERLLEAAVVAAPEVAGPRDDLAGAYLAAGLWAAAVQQLRTSIAVDSGRAPPWGLLPRALLGAGDTTGAGDAAAMAARRFPEEESVVDAAADVLAGAGRCGEARTLRPRVSCPRAEARARPQVRP